MEKLKFKTQDSGLRTVRSGHMKGMTSSILSILLTIVLLYVAVYSIEFGTGSGIVITRKAEFQQDMYAMSNALESAKLYMDTALKYSTYQAFYDYGKEDKTDASSIDILSLQVKIKENLNKYTAGPYTFLSKNYEVSLPLYESASVDVDYPDTNITANPIGSLSTTRADPIEKIKLEKNGKLEMVFNYPLLSQIDQVKPSSLKDKMSAFMEKNWKKDGVKTLEGCENKENAIKDADVFNSAHGTSFNSLEESGKQVASSIEAEMIGLKSTELPEKIKIEVSAKKSEAKISIAQICAEETKDDCDNPNPTFSKKKTCKFVYQYEGSFLITMTDSSKEYPVSIKDGETKKVVFRPFSFSTANSFDFVYI